MDRTELTRRIVGLSAEHGFDRCGIAPVERLAGSLRLHEWLEQGMHGSMHWMARNAARRADPRRVVDGARSVVVVAMNYYTDDEPTIEPTAGCISRYAWGNEYHRVVGDRVAALYEAIESLVPGLAGRRYVDTGPVLEKAWAERAGLGWIGKHTNLINRDLGSWVFLGAIILDVELDAGRPHRDYCGTCRACIDVCPTDAIVAPYILDARLCISYLTIEHRGPIPVELRAPMGNRIFGCDDCQDVCPWNRFAQPTLRITDFAPRDDNLEPPLAGLLELGEEEFRQRFRDSPVRRAKHAGFRRNVAVAMGNSGDRRFVDPLVRVLDDRAGLVRGHAAWALGELGDKRARPALTSRLAVEADDWVGEELRAALDRLDAAGPDRRPAAAPEAPADGDEGQRTL